MFRHIRDTYQIHTEYRPFPLESGWLHRLLEVQQQTDLWFALELVGNSEQCESYTTPWLFGYLDLHRVRELPSNI